MMEIRLLHNINFPIYIITMKAIRHPHGILSIAFHRIKATNKYTKYIRDNLEFIIF